MIRGTIFQNCNLQDTTSKAPVLFYNLRFIYLGLDEHIPSHPLSAGKSDQRHDRENRENLIHRVNKASEAGEIPSLAVSTIFLIE